MALRTRLSHPPVTNARGHSCSVGKTLCTLATLEPSDDPGGEYMSLVNALVDPNWTSSALSRAMGEEGYKVSERHLREHRQDRCTSANCPLPNAGILS